MHIIDFSRSNGKYLLFLIRNVTVGFMYPLIIAIGISYPYKYGWTSFFAVLLFVAPWMFFIFIYLTYRFKYYITEIKYDDNIFNISYYKWGMKKDVIIGRNEISVTFKRDQSTPWEYYVLRIKVNGQIIIRQYQYNDWKKEAFIVVNNSLKDLPAMNIESVFSAKVAN